MPSPPSAGPRVSVTRTDDLLHTLIKSGDPSPYGVDSVAVGDLDGKNVPDIVALATYGTIGTVFVLLNNGDGTFAAPKAFPTCHFLATS